ncbi:MAG: hypothetical protein KDC88_15350 [Ignavibacteriae bacterium]|nr:hypothetical protein [Ignavibacteriota bacterium]MCB9210250.1 hypothetical protein [Ignavibacteriales bacterium]MCB9219045.1 hypothetical protein [Ignavibacteriales bacterium]MCB9259628.1 hypothetical protein [Ignavibacteriales bacterium]
MLYDQESSNPLAELISDETFRLLNSKGLLNEKSLRDYQIRKKFKSLRSNNINASDAIDLLRKDYPYLQFDTMRKIVYHIK